MVEVIARHEIRRVGTTLRSIQADQGSTLSRMDGIERRFAVTEERQAEQEHTLRCLREQVDLLDRKMDTVIAVLRDEVAEQLRGFEARNEVRFKALETRMDRIEARFDEVLAAIADLKACRPA